MLRPLRQGLLKRREDEKQQRGQRHDPPPTSWQAAEFWQLFRRGQMGFQNRSRRRCQPNAAPMNQVARFPVGRKL